MYLETSLEFLYQLLRARGGGITEQVTCIYVPMSAWFRSHMNPPSGACPRCCCYHPFPLAVLIESEEDINGLPAQTNTEYSPYSTAMQA